MQTFAQTEPTDLAAKGVSYALLTSLIAHATSYASRVHNTRSLVYCVADVSIPTGLRDPLRAQAPMASGDPPAGRRVPQAVVSDDPDRDRHSHFATSDQCGPESHRHGPSKFAFTASDGLGEADEILRRCRSSRRRSCSDCIWTRRPGGCRRVSALSANDCGGRSLCTTSGVHSGTAGLERELLVAMPVTGERLQTHGSRFSAASRPTIGACRFRRLPTWNCRITRLGHSAALLTLTSHGVA